MKHVRRPTPLAGGGEGGCGVLGLLCVRFEMGRTRADPVGCELGGPARGGDGGIAWDGGRGECWGPGSEGGGGVRGLGVQGGSKWGRARLSGRGCARLGCGGGRVEKEGVAGRIRVEGGVVDECEKGGSLWRVGSAGSCGGRASGRVVLPRRLASRGPKEGQGEHGIETVDSWAGSCLVGGVGGGGRGEACSEALRSGAGVVVCVTREWGGESMSGGEGRGGGGRGKNRG